MIPYARQDIIQEDIDAVKEVLESDWLTQGPMVERFESAVCNYTKAKYASAVNSATSALHIACLALGVKEGDWVWTSPNTFVSSANCAIYCGAKVDFIDIDPKTYNISVSQLEEKLKKAKIKNMLPKVVIPVHFAGQPCEMLEIYKLSKIYNFRIIEDASHAIGASYSQLDENGKELSSTKVGSCEHSDITIFSFHPVKIITTGEGGMAITNHKDINAHIKLLRSHGVTKEEEKMTHKADGPWYYQQIELGFNYRMNDIQAALGYQQMKRLDNYIMLRHKIAKYYDTAFVDFPINKPLQLHNTYSAYHLYVITLNKKYNKEEHNEIFRQMHNKGIGIHLHYIPVHTQPFYKKMGFKLGDYPIAEDYYKRAISLPMYPNLNLEDQDLVIKGLKECL